MTARSTARVSPFDCRLRNAMAMIHATCIAVSSCGVLLLGPSGAGKSALALRLIDGGAVLVADDQVVLISDGSTLQASPPPELEGRIEVRGIGIIDLVWRAPVEVGLAVQLAAVEPPRLPTKNLWRYEGIDVASIAVSAFTPSAAARVRLAVRAARHDSTTSATRAFGGAEAR